MTVRELYEYAKKHDVLDFDICGTAIDCGPYFDRIKIHRETRTIGIEDGQFYNDSYFEENGFDLIPFRGREYKK